MFILTVNTLTATMNATVAKSQTTAKCGGATTAAHRLATHVAAIAIAKNVKGVVVGLMGVMKISVKIVYMKRRKNRWNR